jgi:hypothetical protein
MERVNPHWTRTKRGTPALGVGGGAAVACAILSLQCGGPGAAAKSDAGRDWTSVPSAMATEMNVTVVANDGDTKAECDQANDLGLIEDVFCMVTGPK